MKLSEIIDNVNEEFESETLITPEDGYTLKPLSSVGCWICTEAGPESVVSVGTTFPDGTLSEDMSDDTGVHIDDCSDEWWDSLDNDDWKTVGDIVHSLEVV